MKGMLFGHLVHAWQATRLLWALLALAGGLLWIFPVSTWLYIAYLPVLLCLPLVAMLPGLDRESSPAWHRFAKSAPVSAGGFVGSQYLAGLTVLLAGLAGSGAFVGGLVLLGRTGVYDLGLRDIGLLVCAGVAFSLCSLAFFAGLLYALRLPLPTRLALTLLAAAAVVAGVIFIGNRLDLSVAQGQAVLLAAPALLCLASFALARRLYRTAEI